MAMTDNWARQSISRMRSSSGSALPRSSHLALLPGIRFALAIACSLGCAAASAAEVEGTVQQGAPPGPVDAPVPACATQKAENGSEKLARLLRNDCVQLTEPRRWSGIWSTGFEHSQFCPAPAEVCRFRPGEERIWLEFAGGPLPSGSLSGNLFRLEFVGRRTKTPGMHGHLGASDHKIMVDRLIRIEPLAQK